jgi:hypothetical protein
VSLKDILDVSVAVGTGLLALGTFWLARSTRSMAEATKRAVEIESEPQFRFDEVLVAHLPDSPPGPSGVKTQLQLRLWNPGKVRVHYKMDFISVRINGIVAANGQGGRGTIHPGGKEIYFTAGIPLPAPVPIPSNGEIRVRVDYWSVPGQVRTFRASVNVTIWFSPKAGSPWVYIDGPHDEAL